MSILDSVTAGARAAWPFIQAGVEAGQTGAEIYRQLQAGGLGARKQDVLALVREAAGAQLARSDYQRFLKDQVPDVSRVRESTTKIIAPYSYTVEVTLHDVFSGFTQTVLRTAHSNNPLSPEDAAAAFLADFAPDATYNGLVVEGTTTIDMVKAGPAGVI